MSRILSDVTVIVPTLGRPVLARTLAALADGTRWPSTIVLADQGEVAAALGILRPLVDAGVEVVHLRFPPAGPAAARNRAIDAASTRWLAAVDDDCPPAGDWLETLVARLRRHPDAIVTGRVAPPEDGSAAPSLLDAPVERVHRRLSLGPDPLHSGNFGVALATARRIGPFDETLHAAEDNDWGWRALRLGVPIVTAPEVVVVHDDERTAADRLMVERRYARGQGRFYGKHLRRLDARIAARAARDWARALARWGRGVSTGDATARASGRIWTVELPRGLVAGFLGRPWRAP